MRLQELEIQNIRGIRHLLLKPHERNLVIWGPNGSGKSAVVDAIDFLLTGRISRLMGEGTEGITLSKHGPHIDCVKNPKAVLVRAVIRLPGVRDPLEIKRCMANPNHLGGLDGPTAPALEAVVSLARRGQHVLTRREILKYIAAKAGTRAQQIQELLNVTKIETIRKSLVNAKGSLDTSAKNARAQVDKEKAAINAAIQARTFSPETVLTAVNQQRAVLGGPPIQIMASGQVKAGLKAPVVVVDSQGINTTLLEADIKNLRLVTSSSAIDEMLRTEEQLRDLLEKLRADPRLLVALSRMELTRRGLTLLDASGTCPLCDTPWPPGKLREYLQQRQQDAQVAAQHRELVEELSSTILSSLNRTVPSVTKLVAAASTVGLEDRIPPLRQWLSNLQELSATLTAALDRYPHSRFGSEKVAGMLAPDGIDQLLREIHSAAKRAFPESTPEQDAWQTLIQLELSLKRLEDSEDDLRRAQLTQKRAETLLSSFLDARDTILGKLYEEIKDRFVDLYRRLHELDEGEFTANLKPDEAALELEVDFYGRGPFPPHALHSEGHQDSMGLCLYLALAERLNQDLIELTILDDVVMSVDADHRKQVCQVLSTCFPERQFLITTHDKTWANQLKTESVVHSKGLVEFYNWNVTTGPKVNYETDMWQRIEEDLQKNDVPSAAARLRRGSEQFFSSVCDSLQVPVVFKLTSRWTLGDLLPPAMGKYRSLLKQSKKVAQSWGLVDLFEKQQELDTVVAPIFTRTKAEEWAVNAAVHYDNWHNLSAKDLRPVVEAFQDLFGLFQCATCGGMLRLASMGSTEANVCCKCGKVNWNLRENRK